MACSFPFYSDLTESLILVPATYPLVIYIPHCSLVIIDHYYNISKVFPLIRTLLHAVHHVEYTYDFRPKKEDASY